MSGSLAIVGAYQETLGGNIHAGQAYVFNAKTGALVRTLTSPNAQDYGSFGLSVAISGSLAVVGAWAETAGGYSGAGHAYVFNAKTGALLQTLTSPNAQLDGHLGIRVAISGSLAVVSAFGETAGGYSGAGHAYVFNAKTGALVQTLTSPNPQHYGDFGWGLSISGSFAMVGAVGETAGESFSAGHAYVFNAKTGALVQTLSSPNPTPYSGFFGDSVSISGSLAIVGAGQEAASGYSLAGHAYAYSKGWLSS